MSQSTISISNECVYVYVCVGLIVLVHCGPLCSTVAEVGIHTVECVYRVMCGQMIC